MPADERFVERRDLGIARAFAENDDDEGIDKVQAGKLSKSYQKKAKKIARRRIAYAGHRLAEVFKNALDDRANASSLSFRETVASDSLLSKFEHRLG